MVIGIDPTVDFAFKKLLGSRDHPTLTISFINAVLGGTPLITGVEILNPFLDKGFDDDKLAILDVKARDDHGRWLNIELPKYTPAGDNGIITDPIEKWVHFFRRAKDSTPQELIDRLGEEVFAEASGVLEMIAKTPRERELYEARLKLQRDEHARLQAAEDQGRAEGFQEGHAEGFQAGEFAGRIRLLQKLLKLPISQELESRSLDELASMEHELERRFSDEN